MARKAVEGKIRNTERSKQKLLKAVGKIIKTKGFSGLGVNHIAAVAAVDKKMIYQYFGNLDGLLDSYVASQDFWSNVKGEETPEMLADAGQTFVKSMLHAQFDYVKQNKEFQKILLWRLSEQRDALQKLTDKQELAGEALLQGIADPFFGEKSAEYRAIMAILVAGSYYLNLYAELNGSVFCGIDIAATEGRNKIKDALDFLIDQSYEGLSRL